MLSAVHAVIVVSVPIASGPVLQSSADEAGFDRALRHFPELRSGLDVDDAFSRLRDHARAGDLRID